MFRGLSFQTRPPPPSGHPPPYAFSRYFNYNLRPVVIAVAVAAAVYAIIWGASAFSSLSPDKSHNLGQLVPFDITLGSVYMAVAAIEIFGIWAAIRQSRPMVRLYVMLSLFAVVIIFGTEILRLVVHFKFKQPMIKECIAIASSNSTTDDNFGFIGSHHAHGLQLPDAMDYCNDAWSRNTFSDIAWLVFSLIASLIFSSIAYSYYRQLLDPSSLATRYPRRQPDGVPLDTFRSQGDYGQYSQQTGLGYNAGPSSSQAPEYAPPYESSKLPGYSGYAENVDPDSKVKSTDEEKDLAGVSL